MNTRLLVAILSLLFLSSSGAAEVAPQFTKFAGFELDSRTHLSNVEEALGPARLIERGEAGEYEARICYVTPNGVISFLSSEMGGPEHTLLGFSVANVTDRAAQACGYPHSGTIPGALIIGGLRLGITRAQFAEVVADHVQWEGNVGRRFFTGTEPMTLQELERTKQFWPGITERPYFDVSVTVIGTFGEGKLVEYEVWKISTM